MSDGRCAHDRTPGICEDCALDRAIAAGRVSRLTPSCRSMDEARAETAKPQRAGRKPKG